MRFRGGRGVSGFEDVWGSYFVIKRDLKAQEWVT